MQTYQLSICLSLIRKKSFVYSLNQTNKIQLFIKVVLKRLGGCSSYLLRCCPWKLFVVPAALLNENIISFYFILVGIYFEQLLDFTNKFESKQQRPDATNILCYGNTLSARVRLRNCYVQFHRDMNRVNHRRCRCHSRLCERIVHKIWTVGTCSDRGLKAQGNRDRNDVKYCCDCIYAATLKASI